MVQLILPLTLQRAAAEQTSTAEKTTPAKPIEGNTQSTSVIEDLFKDSPSIMPSASDKPQKDVKNDIMSLFEKVVSYSIMHLILLGFITLIK